MSEPIELTLYDPTGRITMAKMISEVLPISVEPYGLYVYGMYDPRKFWVPPSDHPEATPRPPNPTLMTGHTLYNIPMPSQLQIGNDIYEVTDSTMELSFPLPGTYHVTVLSFPEVDAEFTMVQP